MLTLIPGSSCDVCAEEYGPHRLPHCIPCGHVLCASCCTTIVEKTSPRLSPVCPFCREHFSSDDVRLIRIDFSSSGWSTPRRLPNFEANSNDFASEVLARKTERLLLHEGSSKTREARRLEDKVARVATQKCSVEEVSSLHKELHDWLLSEVPDDQTSSLYLSAALLRAILMNHVSHTESSKLAKTTEANLKGKVDDLELTNGKFESELRRQKLQYAQKSQECQQLRTEVSQLRALATTLGTSSSEVPTSPPPSTTSPPVSPYGSSSSSQSAMSRLNPMHVRSASMSSRPSTPATPTPLARSQTPAVPLRSHTPAPARSHTPAPPRSHTPAMPPMPPPPIPRSHTPAIRTQTPSLRSHTPSIRSHTPAPPLPRLTTPGPNHYRNQTPAPPLVPPKSRRLSQSSPPKMSRSTSEEKAEAHELWIPPPSDPDYQDYSSKSYKYASRPPSRTASYSISSAARFRDVRTPSPI